MSEAWLDVRKGGVSGHQQEVRALRVDCDADLVRLEVVQKGGIACQTGRQNGFFRELRGQDWIGVDPVPKDSKRICG